MLTDKLVDSISEDYNDFVSLSTKLVNVDGAVTQMQSLCSPSRWAFSTSLLLLPPTNIVILLDVFFKQTHSILHLCRTSLNLLKQPCNRTRMHSISVCRRGNKQLKSRLCYSSCRTLHTSCSR